ncbi:aldo/keto reductase [Amycolatopsis sp. NPDC088138]|uniref:aldo/keto reductase n=1 Tax=Amycolatopsis sp. NPDC088138 TaxID=3363938 RepID=UPI0037F6036E
MLVRTIGDERLRLTVSGLCLGTMNFGTRTDEATSLAILDRFRDAGGTFLDTANNYNQWLDNGDGGESEALIGRWLCSRKAVNSTVVATKAGARTTVSGDVGREHWEGLTSAAIRKAAEGSLHRLGTERLDLYYAHIDERGVPLEESAGSFAELAAEGVAGLIGASNITAWRLAEARQLAVGRGWAPYTCVQQMHTYLWPRPGLEQLYVVGDEMVDYVGAHADVTLLGYSPLFAGYYSRRNQPPSHATNFISNWRRLEVAGTAWDHESSWRRLAVLDEVSDELGATPNQVILAWILGSEPSIIPIFSVSSVPQLEECLGALEISLAPELRQRLDSA